ncbi:MAG TPA: MYXO-CTERM sorting domain-containing protein, partial [Myxococcales bacterium]|nr:MYXO-CTERM sorting domain-containing protein [Myxococcales bacterium]
PECETGRIDFQATHTVRGANGLPGLDGGLTVRVFPTLGALSGALALTADAGPGVVFGTLGLGGVQCPSLRSISGSVEVYRRSDGGFVGSSSLPSVPGTYSVPVSGLCGGGLVEVRASALDTTGGVGPVTADVQMPVQPVGFTAASVNDFQIDCGDVARAQAAVTFDSTQCTSARIDWSSTGAVAIVPATGTPANLETVSSDFGGLIGMPVDVFATATAETGVDGGAAPRVLVRPARPPVTAVHVTDTAVASESRVFGVSVTLTNTTTCDVSSVEWHGWLDGLALVGTSVTGPDGGIEVVPDGGEFVVPGLSLPAGRSLTLRYSARPTLFGEPRPGGVAILRTVRISEEGGLPAPRDTCGCQSASGAGTAALLGVLAAALLRKRRVRSRS